MRFLNAKAHNTCRQSWFYLDNNGTVTYKTIIHTTCIQHQLITINIKPMNQAYHITQGPTGSSPLVAL